MINLLGRGDDACAALMEWESSRKWSEMAGKAMFAQSESETLILLRKAPDRSAGYQ
jgi:hypothetical protein